MMNPHPKPSKLASTCPTCSSLLPDAQKLARRVAGLPNGRYVLLLTRGDRGVWWELLLPYGDKVETGR